MTNAHSISTAYMYVTPYEASSYVDTTKKQFEAIIQNYMMYSHEALYIYQHI